MERKLLRKESFNAKKIWRAALFASTGLSAVLSIPAMARAQTTIPSDTTPQGGVVVGGSASITQAPASTTVDQGSERAAINWQSFDVGSGAKVQFNQPDSSAIALNRVVGGNLSQINGQINANGQIVLINQSGVVFGRGAQVNAENIVVSTSDISTPDFMAGHMAFTGAPNPGAKILNEGKITVKDTGLVGLIAPQVENDGVIVARLGQVVLAGASAFTLDLYGDKLISLDVTKAVQAVDVNGLKVAALVTNRGVILANGGKVTLTAQDADALVTQLIDAGGTIRADSVGSKAGTISIQGVGGDISISGNLLARGKAIGTSGGAIEAETTGTVSVAPSADIDASGNEGGGVIAIGTDIARAQQGAADVTAPKAAAVAVARGATLKADATGTGNAGTVTLLSSQSTAFDGAISIQGGPQGGNGGTAEISSDGVISLGGTVLATAVNGKAGEILLDPQTLVVSGTPTTAPSSGSAGRTIVGDTSSATVTSYILNTDLDALNGTIILEAASLISVSASVNSTSIQALSLASQGSISVTASIDITGSIDLDAAGSLFVGAGLTGSSVLLMSGSAGTEIDAGVNAASVSLGSSGTIFEDTATGSIVTSTLVSAGSIIGDVSLSGGNTITTLDGFTLGGNLTLANAGGLTVGGSVSAANISLSGASLTFESGVSATGVLALSSTGTISQGHGTISADTLTGNGTSLSLTDANAIGTLGGFSVSSGGTLALNDATSLDINGNVIVSGGTLALGSKGSITQSGGSITAGTIASIGSIGGDALFTSNTNSISNLGGFTVSSGTLTLDDTGALTVAGTVSAPTTTLSASSGITINGDIDAPTELALGSGGAIIATAGSIRTGNLISDGIIGASVSLLSTHNSISGIGDFTLGGGLRLVDTGNLDITGLVSAASSVSFDFIGGGASETGAGAIDAASLNAVSGDLLLTGSNTISAIDNKNVSSTGSFALNNTVSLAVQGNVTGADVAIAAPTIALSSGVKITANASAPTLALASDEIDLGGSNSFAANHGTIFIAPLTASTIIDFGGASSAGTLGLPGSLISALDTTASAIVIGNGPVGSQASAIDIDSSASFGGTSIIDLSTSGSISQNTGTLTASTLEFDSTGFSQASGAAIDAGTLAGDGTAVAGSVLLLSATNAIGTLNGFALSSGTFALVDTGSLDTEGLLAAPIVTLSYDTLGLNGTIAAPTLLALSGSLITEGGSITTGSLTGAGTIGRATLTGRNSIAAIGGLTLSGDLALSDQHALDIAGAVTTAGNITLSGTSLTESTGSLVANTLTTGAGSFSSNVSLSGASNTIASLGAFTVASGTLTLDDTGTLTVADTISAPTTTLSASGSIDIESDILASNELALGSGGTIIQGSGVINTGSLVSDGSIGGAVTLAQPNSISELGNFTLGSGFILVDTASLDVTGLVQATSSGSSIKLKDDNTISVVGTLSADSVGLSALDSIDLAGTIDAPTLLALQGGLITQNSGKLIAGSLSSGAGTSANDVFLTSGTNTIASLGSFFALGSFALADTGTLDINGSVSAENISLAVPTLALSASVDATIAGGTLALATDLLTTSSGTLSANAGTVELAPYTSGNGVDLGGSAANALDIAGNIGSLFGGSPVAYVIGAAAGSTASFIDIDGSVSFASGTVDLATSGVIQDNTGTLIAPTLEFDAASFTQSSAAAITAGTLQGDGGAISGNVLLAGNTNAIGTLGGLSLASGTLAITDAGTLIVTGSVSAPDIYLSDSDAGGITVSGGSLVAGNGGTIGLTSDALGGNSGTISAADGLVLIAPDSLGKDIDFGGTGLGGLGLSTGFMNIIGGKVLQIGTGTGTITQAQNFSIASQTLVLDGASINVTGTLGVPTLLSVASAGDISESSGATLSVPSLTGTANGTIGLIGTNAIGTLDAVSAGSDITINNGPSLLIAGLVGTGTGNSITLDDNAGVTEVTGGTLSAGTLTTGTGSIAGAALLGNANRIGTIAGFTATGDLTFLDSGALTLTGPVSGADAYFTASGIGITGSVDVSAGTLGLVSSSDITEALPGGTLTAGTLTGTVSSGSATLLTANSITNLGAFSVSNGNFTLNNAIGLNIAGPVAATDIDLSGTSLTEAGGTLTATSLSTGAGEFSNDVSLTGTNTINTLGGFTVSTGTLTLDDTGLLTVAGTVAAPVATLSSDTINVAGTLSGSSASVSADAGGIGITGLINTGSLLALASNGDITESSNGGIDAGTLISASAINGNVLLGDTLHNAISTLGGFTIASGDTLVLDESGLLSVTGPVSASYSTFYAGTLAIDGAISGTSETLTGGNIDIQAAISVANDLALETPGNVTESTGGTISAGTLTTGGTDIGGNAILASLNSIGTLGGATGFTIVGTLDLADAGTPTLAINGQVAATNATITANTISVPGSFSGTTATFSAGSIDIGGLVSLSTLLALESSGDISESTGTVDAATLTTGGTPISGNVSLTGPTNSIGTLGGFTLASGGTSMLDLADAGLLTVAGPVSAPNATLSAGSLSITGQISIAQALALDANSGGIDESTGQINAGTLTSGGSVVAGSVALTSSNTIGTLGNFAATGFIILDNSPSLTIDGLVSTAGALTLAQTGDITEVAGGTLAVGTLSSGAVATGNVTLGNANSITTLGAFTVSSGDTLALTNTGLLTIAGPVVAPVSTIASDGIKVSGTLSGGVATLSAGSIDIGGSISLASLLALESSGNITESTGFVTVPTLTSGGASIIGDVTLGNANSIGTLSGFTTGSDLVLDDGTPLTVTGPLSAADATLTADGIAIPGDINTTGTLAFYSAGDVTETGGTINAALLTGMVTNGDATLEGSNTITSLGAFTVSSGTLALDDTGVLIVAGTVNAPTTTLSAQSAILIGSDINALTELALGSQGNIVQTAGTINTDDLISGGSIGGAVTLAQPNSISELGNFTLGGGFILVDNASLDVAGLVQATGTGSNIALFDSSTISVGGTMDADSVLLNAPNSIDLSGTIDAPTSLVLQGGDITQNSGALVTGSLSSGGVSTGDVSLASNTNTITTLGNFIATALSLNDTGLLTVAGPVTAPVTTLSAPTIAINGTLDAATQLALQSTGNVTEGTVGAVTAGILSGAVGGNITLNGTLNSITTLGQVSAAGLALNDQTALAITSPVAVSGVLALLDSGNITETGGTISAGTLTSNGGTIGGAATFNQQGNAIPVLGAFGAVAGLALSDAVPLNLVGNIFTGSTAPLSLIETGGAITQSGGSINAGTLNVNGSNVTLGQANAIGTAGAFNATNAYVEGVGGVSGPVNVTTGTFLSANSLVANGNINATNLVLEALSDISQTAGNISASAATLIAGGNIILSGVLAAAGDLDLISGGNISHPAGLLTAGTLSGGVGGTVVTALGAIDGKGTLADFDFSSPTTDFGTIGNFIMQDTTFALNNDGPLVLHGSLVANTVSITTNGNLTFEGSADGSGGGLFIGPDTISTTPNFTPQPGDSVITVTNGGITQTGVFDINSANGPAANLFLYLSGGSVAFATSGELFAPTTNLEISDQLGSVSGNVVLERLVILNALTQSVELTGQLDGVGGQAAASKGFVDPFPQADFRFNACPIGSVNCTILPIETLPQGNPLENFDLSQRKRSKLNKNVHLPGVATRDF